MIKITGIIILSVGISMYGSILSLTVKERHIIICELLSLIKAIKNGIKYGSVPLEKIYNSTALPNLEKYGFLNAIKDGTLPCSAVNTHLQMLSHEDRDNLCEFFQQIGKSSSTDAEITLCDRYIILFEQREKDSLKENLEKSVLYKKLGIVAALVAAIIFL